MARAVEVAARAGGLDTSSNLALGYAIDNAKGAGVPKDVIQRALDRVQSGASVNYEEVLYEAAGPGGVSVMVDCHTDNRKRTAPLVRLALKGRGGELLTSGGAAFAFTTVGRVIVDMGGMEEDALLEMALEAGAEEVEVAEGTGVVTTAPADLHAVVTGLREGGMEIVEAGLHRQPTAAVQVGEEDAAALDELVDALEELEDVHRVTTNSER